MGLDMTFFEIWGLCPHCGQFQREELHYFRKHADLHGWLYDQWEQNKAELNYSITNEDDDIQTLRNVGEDSEYDEFNCCYMLITKDVLNKVKRYVKAGKYRKYEGFFWGESDAEQWEETESKLIPEIEEAFKRKHMVFYHPWW